MILIFINFKCNYEKDIQNAEALNNNLKLSLDECYTRRQRQAESQTHHQQVHEDDKIRVGYKLLSGTSGLIIFVV